MLVKDFGQRVRAARLSQGISQAELAKEGGISRTYLSQIERGEAVNLSWQVRKALADAVGIPVEPNAAEVDDLENLPRGLAEFAQEKNLPEGDILMLARLEYRGQKPTTPEQWRLLYSVIKTVISSE